MTARMNLATSAASPLSSASLAAPRQVAAADVRGEGDILERVLLDRRGRLLDAVHVDLVERAELAAHARPVVDAPHRLEHERGGVERDPLQLLVGREERLGRQAEDELEVA